MGHSWKTPMKESLKQLRDTMELRSTTMATKNDCPWLANCYQWDSERERQEITSTTGAAKAREPRKSHGDSGTRPSRMLKKTPDGKEETHFKNQWDSGSRTDDRKHQRNTLPNRDRSRVKRDLTKLKSEWKVFKLMSFNVWGLNQESKRKIVYDLLKHSRP